jgi:hypothetical protein
LGVGVEGGKGNTRRMGRQTTVEGEEEAAAEEEEEWCMEEVGP